MNAATRIAPTALVTLLTGIALWHGPIAQLPDYHAFADVSVVYGIPHFADVVSNAGFALVALWAAFRLPRVCTHRSLVNGWAGYRLFLIGLVLTAFGSAWYHLAPDNARLVWDRLPITLACGGLLAGVWGDVRGESSAVLAAWMAALGVYSVAWWYLTEIAGQGDLRFYLLLQILPMLLIPLWQWLYRAPLADRLSFSAALLLYAAAKLTEINDHQIAEALGVVTGHTLKHLLATGAAAVIVGRLVCRVRLGKKSVQICVIDQSQQHK